MADVEVLIEACKNLFKYVNDLRINDKQKNMILKRLFSISKDIKDVKEFLEVFE